MSDLRFHPAGGGAGAGRPKSGSKIGRPLLNSRKQRTQIRKSLTVTAEATLLESHQILSESRKGNQRLIDTLIISLAELYEAWGKTEKAAEYRARLEEEES